MGALEDKSLRFAVDTVKTCRLVQQREKEYDLTRQLIRSSTSIGANIEEGEGAVSRADFRNKLAIAYKEARESRRWLKILLLTEIISANEHAPLHSLCEELCKMLASSLLTMQNGPRKL